MTDFPPANKFNMGNENNHNPEGNNNKGNHNVDNNVDNNNEGNNNEDKAVRLLQGYIWHPQDADVTLADYLPKRVGSDIHLLWDAITPPFTFFDDGTLAATQTIYQFTALMLVDAETAQDSERFDPTGITPWLADTLTEKLEHTPAGVGWQIMEDLREL